MSESIIDDLYETICRIERDGGDPNDQETWDRYWDGAEHRPRWEPVMPSPGAAKLIEESEKGERNAKPMPHP